jgi:hypothetical protein
MEVSLEPTIQVEKTLDLNLQRKKRFTQSSSVLCPKDQLSWSKTRKKEETDQQDILHKATVKPPLESPKDLKNILEEKLVGGLKETAKVTSGNKKKPEREKAQIQEPMPQYSRV